MAEYFERVLTDAATNVYEERYEVSSENFLGEAAPPWRMTKFRLHGGKQDGVDVVEMDNGELTVVLLPTRGMGILEAYTSELSLGWQSPVRQVVHPAHVDEETCGGLGWLEGFNEFICRCGPAYHGDPGPDMVPTNTGALHQVTLPLHGTIANTPAARVAVRVRPRPPYELSVVGEVYDTRMFGTCYRMESVVSTVPGSSEFAISDTIENLGGTPSELELLYHCNYGPPLLGEGAQVLAPVEYVCPRDQHTLEESGSWDTYGAPEAGYAERCYFLRLHGDENGKTVVALVTPDGSRAATIRYSVQQLPAFTMWKNTAAEADGYVTGLEPGTDYPNSRRFERERGRVVELPPGGTYETKLRLAVVSDPQKVAKLRDEVDSLVRDKPSEVAAALDPDYCPDA